MRVLLVTILSVIPLLSMDKPSKTKRRNLSSRFTLRSRRAKSNPENAKEKKELANKINACVEKHQYMEVEKQGKNGSGFNIYGNDLQAPLHCAVRSGNAASFVALLNEGAWINIPDKDGKTPLHLICQDQYFLKAFADYFREFNSPKKKLNKLALDVQDEEGRTPLHDACIYNNLAAVKFLISLGAALKLKDNSKHLPIELATDIEVINCLLQEGSPRTNAVEATVHKIHLETLSNNQAEVAKLLNKLIERTKPFEEFERLKKSQAKTDEQKENNQMSGWVHGEIKKVQKGA